MPFSPTALQYFPDSESKWLHVVDTSLARCCGSRQKTVLSTSRDISGAYMTKDATLIRACCRSASHFPSRVLEATTGNCPGFAQNIAAVWQLLQSRPVLPSHPTVLTAATQMQQRQTQHVGGGAANLCMLLQPGRRTHRHHQFGQDLARIAARPLTFSE